MKLFGLRFGKPIEQPPLKVEIEPEIRSINLNGEKYLNYSDVINFLNGKEINEGLSNQTRFDLDKATFFT